MEGRIPSSFGGFIDEIPEVYADNFENPFKCRATAYFLSHYHQDHIVGLHSLEFRLKLEEEKNIFIYANEVTSAIVKFNNPHIADYVKVLQMGENIVSVPKVDADNEQSVLYLSVTLIPAGHCFGSTMFLFETPNVRVLYTGDFRIRPKDTPKYAAFHDPNGQVLTIDAMYLDTTFNRCDYENFPKRSESVEEAVDLIKRWVSEGKHVILDTPATYGYEYLFNEIYKVLKMKVYVSESKWELYSSMLHLVPSVTNNREDTKIYEGFNLNEFVRYIPNKARVKFSARRWKNWTENKSCVEHVDEMNATVCFATHCSNSEIISFVNYLKPTRVKGFRNQYVRSPSPVRGEKVLFETTPKKTPLKRNFNSIQKGENDRKLAPAVMRKLFG